MEALRIAHYVIETMSDPGYHSIHSLSLSITADYERSNVYIMYI